MTEVIAETSLPVTAHHHDFAWERKRFTLNAVNDYLQAAFPSLLINTYAVYARDIDPLGFKTIELTQIVTQDVVDQARGVSMTRRCKKTGLGPTTHWV